MTLPLFAVGETLPRERQVARDRRVRGEQHGHTRGGRFSPTYISWASMLDRCLNRRSSRWEWYGARGVTVCERWASSFVSFLVDMGERPAGTTIDRIDNERGYEPSNCRWSSHAEQCRNRRSSKLTDRDAAAIRDACASGISYSAAAARFGVSKSLVAGIVKGRKWR